MSTKQTPKSCSCRMCKLGKSCDASKFAMKYDERAFRHSQKIALNHNKGGYSPAPHGGYYD